MQMTNRNDPHQASVGFDLVTETADGFEGIAGWQRQTIRIGRRQRLSRAELFFDRGDRFQVALATIGHERYVSDESTVLAVDCTWTPSRFQRCEFFQWHNGPRVRDDGQAFQTVDLFTKVAVVSQIARDSVLVLRPS